MNEHWGVIVNPQAGTRGGLHERTLDALAELGVSASVEASSSPAETSRFVGDFLDEGIRHVAVVGGDGTLNLAVDAIYQADIADTVTISILPAGTGSDFARTFALPQTVELAVGHLRGGTDYPVDIGVLEGAWGRRAFVNIADAGLPAATVLTAERLPRRLGPAKYQAAFWLTLPRFRAATVRLETPKRTHEGRAIAVVFANGQFFGGGLNVAPRAAAMDGLFDLQVIDARIRDAPGLFPKVKRGMHLRHPAVRRLVAASFEFETDRPWPVEADGEFIGHGPISAHIVQGKVAVRLA